MNAKPDLQAIKSANGDRKRRETAIHRIIDDYRAGSNDEHCMRKICQLMKRAVKTARPLWDQG
ncbi:hypothetical protein J2Y63_002418 [Shinella sp. BE166]